MVNGSSKDQGQVTLKESADGTLDESWVLGRGTTGLHTSIADGVRSCSSTDVKGVTTSSSASFSCYRQVPWFAPWVAQTLLSNGVIVSADATSDTDRTAGWIRTKYTAAPLVGITLTQKKVAAFKEFTEATAIYIAVDAKTLLPAQMVVYDHPNSDPGIL